MAILICIAAFIASLLTLFSGFGLGTILMPVFGIFFPLPVAVALTGVVHLLNNLFKLTLLGKSADRSLLLRFGLPSVAGGFVGALCLAALSDLSPLFSWHYGDRIFEVHPLKFLMAVLMIFFALMEIVPRLKQINFAAQYLSAGGLLSGFFGGLSGHQGALRSAFLVNMGLSKEVYIATGVVIACMVDLTRLPVYATHFQAAQLTEQWPLLAGATLSAFAGAYIGTKFMKKTTMASVQALTALMIGVIALLLGAGLI